MKLPFSPDFPLLSADLEFIIDADVEWESGSPFLIINDVLDYSGKVSLLHHDDPFYEDIGFRVADMAEDCPKLLARATEQANYEDAA